MSKDINDACKPIRDAWEDIRQAYAKMNTGKYLELTCVQRPITEQFELFKKGREVKDGKWVVVDHTQVVTNVDGIKLLSAHNYKPSRAIDVVVMDNQTGKALWDEKHYLCLAKIAERVGLCSGGVWQSLKDWPHIELPNYKSYGGI